MTLAEVEAARAHTAAVNADPDASSNGRAGAAQAEWEATEAWQTASPAEAAALDATMAAAEQQPEVTGPAAETARQEARAALLAGLGGGHQATLDEVAPAPEAEAEPG